ncbi:hypothetical protein DNTS_032913 [Danionella cerebrum]|uniref:Uncharacterized protein n=1 Tax=Danionella cerebrum TaxID=2873325 RepID=A0A553MTF9_9TELE|nr:hypothetical protein DNTS_032913 [Danionella translucida]
MHRWTADLDSEEEKNESNRFLKQILVQVVYHHHPPTAVSCQLHGHGSLFSLQHERVVDCCCHGVRVTGDEALSCHQLLLNPLAELVLHAVLEDLLHEASLLCILSQPAFAEVLENSTCGGYSSERLLDMVKAQVLTQGSLLRHVLQLKPEEHTEMDVTKVRSIWIWSIPESIFTMKLSSADRLPQEGLTSPSKHWNLQEYKHRRHTQQQEMDVLMGEMQAQLLTYLQPVANLEDSQDILADIVH